jgi:hypothetical protein
MTPSRSEYTKTPPQTGEAFGFGLENFDGKQHFYKNL